MNHQTIVRIAEYLTLLVMFLSAVFYLYGDHDTAWPYIVVFIIAAWLHGICWGYLYALKGRLTWF